MTTTETSPPRQGGGRRQTPTRRAAASRRRRMRLRRSVALALVVLVSGTVVARFLEDPADVTVAAAAAAAARVDSGASGTRTPRSGLAAAAPVRPASTPSSSATSTASAAPHADAEPDGSTTPAPNAGKVVVPQSGKGTVTPQAIPAGAQKASGRTVRYSVETEDGLTVSSAEFAATVHSVLTDARGWQTKDDVRFVPVSPQQLAAGAGVDVRVTLASPKLTASLCAPLNVTAQQVSCWNGSRAVLNLTRWMLGSATYGSDLASYRIYLISHEVGHGLGHGHVSCPAPGRPAPVMVQQTKSLEGCTASPWPTGS